MSLRDVNDKFFSRKFIIWRPSPTTLSMQKIDEFLRRGAHCAPARLAWIFGSTLCSHTSSFSLVKILRSDTVKF